jgi:HK97 family phage major capsid protein
LLGRKVVLTNYLPSFSATLKKTDVFAMLYDFGDYTLNTNFSIGIKTYEDNETDDIIRKSVMVCDGKPILYESLVKLTGAATA